MAELEQLIKNKINDLETIIKYRDDGKYDVPTELVGKFEPTDFYVWEFCGLTSYYDGQVKALKEILCEAKND